jgi:NAD(P)-dependent dehydrogenase (short-subunit alcohol dehydrogenase family)
VSGPEETAQLPGSQRLALVTGGAKRLGRHLCLTLSRLGFGVIVNYKSSEREANELVREIVSGRRYARAVRADVADRVDVAAMFATIQQTEGRLDVLVNNVGIYEPEAVKHVTPEDWEECIAANLNGAFFCCYHARPMLEESGAGLIVNIGYAGVDLLPGNPWATPYQVSKTGLLVLTRSLAQGLAPKVRVNMISPGQLENSVDLPADVASVVPMGRAGTLEDVAGAMKYLLEAGYVSGANLDVAGGYRLGTG